MKVFCCQHDITWENRDANHQRVRRLLSSEKIPAGSLVVLPEMFAAGFSMNVAAISDGGAQPTKQFLSALAKELQVYVLAGIIDENALGKGRNEALILGPSGQEIGRYCKMQPFAPGGEAAAYEAGTGPLLFSWHSRWVAPFICYDLRFPEIQRPAARAGAHLMTFIASWPDARLAHWKKLLQARAIENQCWVAGVNRIGTDPHFHYSGSSLIINHQGEIVADAGDREGLISAEIDFAAMDAYRQDKPFLADMRSDFVAPCAVKTLRAP